MTSSCMAHEVKAYYVRNKFVVQIHSKKYHKSRFYIVQHAIYLNLSIRMSNPQKLTSLGENQFVLIAQALLIIT